MSPSQRARTLTRPASHEETTNDDNWRDQAACKPGTGVYADLWFIKERKAEALAICATCPVREACLKDAIETRDFEGIRGGRTGRQLRSISKGRPVTPKDTTAALAAHQIRLEQHMRNITALALDGRNAAQIAAELRLSRNRVDHLLSTLRKRGDIPVSAGRMPRPFKPIRQHGTRSGYDSHKRRGQEPCADCYEGYRRMQRERREQLAARVRS